MKNRYNVFLLYLCAVIIVLIGAVQVYNLTGYSGVRGLSLGSAVYFRARASQSITLILAVVAITILLSGEEINRGVKRKAYIDSTGIMNKNACMERMNLLDNKDSTLNIGFVMFDLNNLKQVNDDWGHEEGDKLIQNFVLLLRQASNKEYFLARFGGDEFVAIIENCTEAMMKSYLKRIEELTGHFNRAQGIPISYACGFAISTKEHYYLMDDLLKEADKKMYENKKKMKSVDLAPAWPGRAPRAGQAGAVPWEKAPVHYDYDEFVSALENVLRTCGEEVHLAIVYSDICHFGYFNDVYGHQEGNRILNQFAEQLAGQSCCLFACRMYSDHFACLVDTSHKTEGQSVELVQSWSTRFSDSMSETYKGSRLIVRSGIYFISDSGEPVDGMLNRVIYAHKFAKSSFHSVFVYCEELSQREKRRSEILCLFRSALEQDEFKIYVQPQVLCRERRICGAEALVRWQRPNGLFFYPDEFIPVLEQTGDVIDLDFYVYEKVFAYLHQKEAAGEKHVPVSVNVSRIHLLDVESFIRRLQTLREKWPVSASLLLFELTETAYIQEIDNARLFICELHKLGYRVSMDDFGSGYSSLKALQSMPFDEIKFDRAFLRDCNGKKETYILLQLIQMVKGFHIPIVCEGAETAEHVELLERSMCDMIQGYYFYKPFPIEELKIRDSGFPRLRQSDLPLSS